jgi:hypothetical protein
MNNMFKNGDGQSITQRINQTDVKTTLSWLEQMVDLDLINNLPNADEHSLGKLELTIDSNKISPDQLMAEITQWCNSHELKAREYVKNSGSRIYFRTPINGNPANGYVQTDFSFVTPNETHNESDINFLSRLRDRIVNQGMLKLIESDEAKINGGRAKGIDHIEDLVFRKGTSGIKDALTHIKHLINDTASSATVKWDGKPAIVFGRDDDGEFVLTDISGFTATGYNGLFTSPAHITERLSNRDSKSATMGKLENRVEELGPVYEMLWPMLEQAVPRNFKGFVQGDLLYTETPEEESGALVFKPNTIEYKIPVSSDLGEAIASSQVGIAIHTYYKEHRASKQPIGKMKFKSVPGLLLIEPVKPKENIKPTDSSLLRELRELLKEGGASIDTLFNPAELRQLQISDLPRLCVDYINSIVKDELESNFDIDTLLPQFGEWLKDHVSPRKYNNIVEYLQSPRSNMMGISAAFAAFVLIHEIKLDLLQQLDRQHPGHEGWVIATPGGLTKFVNRFGFTRNNIQNNT